MTVIDEPVFAVEAPPQVKRWTKREYNRLIDRDVFGKQRVMLVRGELIEMPAMGHLHVFGCSNVLEWLVRTLTPDYRIRDQAPFEVPGESVPQPDAAVVTHEQMIRLPQPNAAVLVVEVADSSVELDRQMAFDYAAALVPDYWLINMRDREIEVFRDPVPDATAAVGYRYQSHRMYRDGETIAPLVRPDAVVAVAALLRITR